MQESDYGTNSDGSKNNEYCKHCYVKGKFTDKDLTMQEKIEQLVEKAVKKFKVPEKKAREMAESIIPQLRRWR